MQKWVNRLCVATLAALLCGTAALAAPKKTAKSAHSGPKKVAKGPVAGEDDYRSAIGYTVAVMEHCKALNRLTKTKGSYNAELAREHAVEVVRNSESATRHVNAFVSTSGAAPVATTDAPSLEQSLATVRQFATALDQLTKTGAADRNAVASTSTELYLAAKDMLAAEKASGKAMGIASATPPRKPGAKPKKPKKEVPGEATAAAK